MGFWDDVPKTNSNTEGFWGNENLKTADDWDKEWDEKHPTKKTISLEERQKLLGMVGTPELETSPITWSDSPTIANVNIPGFNVNLNLEPVNVPQLMNRNYQPDELKKVGSKVAETIGNIPLNPVTYATNKIVDSIIGSNNADDSLRVKDLGRLSNAAIALGEKSDNFTEFLRNNAQPDNSIGGIKLPSTTQNLDFATYNKEQNKTKLNNSVEALKGKYEPNPLRLGMSEKQAAQFEKDNPTLAQVGKFGISAVVDPLNFVGLDLIDSLAKGSKVAKTGSKFADDIAELGVRELADKEKYLTEKMPGIQNYIDTAGKRPTPKFTKNIAPIVGEGEEVNQRALQSYMNSKNINNTKTLGLNGVSEVKLQPDYAPTTERNMFTDQTGGIKNIFGTERSTEKLNNVEDATQGLIQEGIKPKKSISSRFEDLYTNAINKDYALSKKDVKAGFGEELQMKAANTSNTKGIVEYVMREKLVDKNGTPIGNSLKSIIDNIPAESQNMFESYILHKHNIPRTENGKPIFIKDMNGIEVTPEYSKAKIAEYEAANPQFKQWSQDLNKWLNDFMQTWGVDTGLISQDRYKALREMYPNYVPTYRILDEVEQGGKSIGKSGKYVDMPNIIKRAKGSSKPVQSPLQNIIELANKTIRTAKNNEVGQYILDAIKANPEDTKAFASIVEEPKTGIENLSAVEGENGIEGVIDNMDKQFANVDKSKPNVVRVMVNGEPTYIKIHDKNFLDAVTGLSKGVTDAEAFGKKYLTGWFKALITQYNPLFTIKNIARDLPVAYINGSEANPVKFILDLKNASKEMGTNGKMWQEYKGLGGASGGFFSVDKNLDRSLYGNAWDRFKGGIEKANVSTEQLPRFAEYMKIVKKYGNTPEARMRGLFAANDLTVNFARKGSSDIVRILDSGVPFLNAGLQGVDKLKRQLMTKPFSTLGKGGFVVATPTLATYLINKDNPYYQQLDNRTKDTYFNIPNYLDTDEKGYPKTFIKIPKTREYGAIFGALFERGLRQAFGEKNSYKGISGTIATNFAPANPLTNGVLAPIGALLNGSNEDFAGRAIVSQSIQKRSPALQYDEKTSELSKAIGKIGISPKILDYLIKTYTGVVGNIALPIMQNKSNIASAPTDILKSNFVANPLYNNQGSIDFYDNKKKLETAKADFNFTKKLPTNPKLNNNNLKLFNNASKVIGNAYDEIRTLDPVKDKAKIEKLRAKINEIYINANKTLDK